MLIDHTELTLIYKFGFGAWTYHLRIPYSRQEKIRWGLHKVSGFIDDVEIKNINLAPRSDGDPIISINQSIRKALNKTANDKVVVTLYLHI